MGFIFRGRRSIEMVRVFSLVWLIWFSSGPLKFYDLM